MNYLFLPVVIIVSLAENIYAQPNSPVLADISETDTFIVQPAIEPGLLSSERPEFAEETLVLQGQVTNFKIGRIKALTRPKMSAV